MSGQPLSQVHQDIFALTTAKTNTYIEIGAANPIKYSNTYRLEVMEGWKGISLELDMRRQEQWLEHSERKNKIYFEDAITFDYISALKENNLDTHIGYLSCDIEPPENTFKALQQVLGQGITFDCITFEHDKYQSEVDYDPIATEYLASKGYRVAVRDVYRWRKRPCYFETWYVHESIDFEETTFDVWREQNV